MKKDFFKACLFKLHVLLWQAFYAIQNGVLRVGIILDAMTSPVALVSTQEIKRMPRSFFFIAKRFMAFEPSFSSRFK